MRRRLRWWRSERFFPLRATTYLTSSGSRSFGGTTTANKHRPGPATASLFPGDDFSIAFGPPPPGREDDGGDPHVEGLIMVVAYVRVYAALCIRYSCRRVVLVQSARTRCGRVIERRLCFFQRKKKGVERNDGALFPIRN